MKQSYNPNGNLGALGQNLFHVSRVNRCSRIHNGTDVTSLLLVTVAD